MVKERERESGKRVRKGRVKTMNGRVKNVTNLVRQNGRERERKFHH
jgi:hypothetical protein